MALRSTERRSGSRKAASTTKAPYALLAPAVLGFTVIFLLPTLYAGWISLHQNLVPAGEAYGQAVQTYVGFDNYRRAITDPELLGGLRRLGTYGAMSVPFTVGLALLFALLLDSKGARLRATTRTAILMPYAIPSVIAAMMWGFLYLPTLSPVNAVAEKLGLHDIDLLGRVAIFGSLANVSIWATVGFNMIVLYTALRGIPSELFDAGRVDGCGEFRLALKIKIPLLTPALILTGLFSLIGMLQTYSEPITLQKISQSISSSFFPLMKVYNDAFFDSDLGIAAATSLLLAAAALVLSGVLLGLLNRRATGDDS